MVVKASLCCRLYRPGGATSAWKCLSKGLSGEQLGLSLGLRLFSGVAARCWLASYISLASVSRSSPLMFLEIDV